MYASLFDAAWDTINSFASDNKHLGASAGMISILHTWGQQLSLHPHLHCIIPAGGLTPQLLWKKCKTNGNFLFPVKALSVVFRAKYMFHLRKHIANYNAQNKNTIVLQKRTLDACFEKQWVVYAKKPFSGINSVVEYLGRYTHKIAISNHRITDIDKQSNSITFRYKDYRQNGKTKQLTIHQMEFVRRFCLHILPKGFVRIRHYGILSSTAKVKAIAQIREQFPVMKVQEISTKAVPYNPKQCPCCKKETMVHLLAFNYRGPPKNWKIQAIQFLQYNKAT